MEAAAETANQNCATAAMNQQLCFLPFFRFFFPRNARQCVLFLRISFQQRLSPKEEEEKKRGKPNRILKKSPFHFYLSLG